MTLKAILSKLFHEWNRQITSGYSSTLYFRPTLTGLIELALCSTGAMRVFFVLWQTQTSCILAIQHCPSSAFLQLFADCLPSGFPSFHTQICTLKVSKDKKHDFTILCKSLQSQQWDIWWHYSVCTERSDCQLILALARHRACDCSPGWVVERNGKAWMVSFGRFWTCLLFCSWSSLRKNSWRSHAAAAALAEGK